MIWNKHTFKWPCFHCLTPSSASELQSATSHQLSIQQLGEILLHTKSCQAATILAHVELSTQKHGDYCATPLQMQAMPPTWYNNFKFKTINQLPIQN